MRNGGGSSPGHQRRSGVGRPEGEVDGDPLVPEEVHVLPPRAGLEQVPESARDPQGREVAAARLAGGGGFCPTPVVVGREERVELFWVGQGPFDIGPK